MGIEADPLEFHKLLLRKLESNRVQYLPQHRPPRSIPTLVFGTQNLHLWTGLSKEHQRIEVGFMLQGKDAEARFRRLLDRRQIIESELGRLDWKQKTAVRCRIMQFKDSDPFDRSLWNGHTDWMILWLEKFAKAFRWDLKP